MQRETRNEFKNFVINLIGRDYFEDLDIRCKIILLDLGEA
jgi:hypothetical protein